MHRPSGVAGGMEKRARDPADLEDERPELKRRAVPGLASVIVEALKVDSLQKLCSSIEPILRRVVSEEVERALAKLGTARITGRSSPKQIEGPDGRNLQLHFQSALSLPLFTGGKVEGEQGAAIHVVLIDANSGLVVTSGPEASAKLDIVVLEGDFNNEDDEGWTEEEFESQIVKEREGKRPLLTGDLQVTLKEGVGTLGELSFTDNSSWIRSRKFRLGLKVAAGFCEGIRIREAKTEAFAVKDHRGELYKKHYPPVLKDEVWRLEKIGKDGSFHKKLNEAGIYSVEDFLRLFVRDSQRLRSILGSNMSNKMWESLSEHAKTCVLSGKLYVYYPDNARNVGAVFNDIYEFNGLINGEQYCSSETLSDHQKVYADTLIKKAYDNWKDVVEFDGTTLLHPKDSQNKRSNIFGNELSVNYPYDQSSSSRLTGSYLPLEANSNMAAGGPVMPGFGHEVSTYPQNAAPNGHLQLETAPVPASNAFSITSYPPPVTRNDSTGLALGPPQPANLEFQPLVSSTMQTSNFNTYDDWSHHQESNRAGDDFFSVEDIRMRSHELLENDEMQQLLRMFTVNGSSNVVSDEGYSYPSYMPSPMPNFNFEDRGPSGKAVVGWLKIKAAMRWGIFVRKKAAERRKAKIIELDD